MYILNFELSRAFFVIWKSKLELSFCLFIPLINVISLDVFLYFLHLLIYSVSSSLDSVVELITRGRLLFILQSWHNLSFIKLNIMRGMVLSRNKIQKLIYWPSFLRIKFLRDQNLLSESSRLLQFLNILQNSKQIIINASCIFRH